MQEEMHLHSNFLPKGERIVETKTCKKCSANFDITDKDLEFYKKISPKFDGKIYEIPTPTLCPGCRQQRRLAFRNERKLYKRKCDATGKDIISIYSPDKPYKVYEQDFWWSDKWDALDYGRDFDFSRSFFEQFGELLREVPVINLENLGSNLENSNFVNYSSNLKNCYLCTGLGESKDCYYFYIGRENKNCVDCSYTVNTNNCYDLSDSTNCYNCFYSKNCINCNDIYYSKDLLSCKFCLFSVGLVNKSYFILNKEYSKEEYFKIKTEILKNKTLLNKYQKIFKSLDKKTAKNYGFFVSCENCTGNILLNSKNAQICFESINLLDCKYVCSSGGSLIYDSDNLSVNSEKLYEAVSCYAQNGCFLLSSNNLQDSYYSSNCHNSSNLFGCVGLKNKQYCILNKQYTKEEYNKLVTKIIEHMQKTGEWGEFFPASISPFGYNETVAQEYFPLSPPLTPPLSGERNKKSIPLVGGKVRMGEFNWSDYEAPFPKVDKIIPAEKLPEDISKIPDDILNWAIRCEVSGKPFRIISQELEFYRKHNLPIPRKHPDVRHKERMKLRNPRKLFDRKCDKCGKEIKSTYAPDRPEIVYCEECYEKKVY